MRVNGFLTLTKLALILSQQEDSSAELDSFVLGDVLRYLMHYPGKVTTRPAVAWQVGPT